MTYRRELLNNQPMPSIFFIYYEQNFKQKTHLMIVIIKIILVLSGISGFVSITYSMEEKIRISTIHQGYAVSNQDLFEATRKGELEKVKEHVRGKEIVRSIASVHDTNSENKTALHIAAANGRKQIVLELLRLGADINAQDKDGWAPLHCAADSSEPGCVEVVEALLEYKSGRSQVDIDLLTVQEKTALWLAGNRENIDIVWLLLRADAYISWCDHALFCLASKKGDVALAKRLMELFSVDSAEYGTGKTVLMIAAENGHFNYAKELIRAGASVRIQNQYNQKTALHYAAIENHPKVAAELVSSNNLYAQDMDGNTPLHDAVSFASQEVIAVLLDADGPLYVNGCRLALSQLEKSTKLKNETALHIALNKKNQSLATRIIKSLFSNEVLSIRSTAGEAPIHIAAKEGFLDVIKAIIVRSNQEELDASDGQGWTALHHAAHKGFFQVVKALLDAGADGGLDLVRSASLSQLRLHRFPILLAIEQSHLDVVRLLLSIGHSDNTKKNLRVITIFFHGAVINEKAEIVLKILPLEMVVNNTTSWIAFDDESSASFKPSNTVNANGWTALHYSVWCGRLKITSLLLGKIDVNIQNADAHAPLHLAINKGYFEEARMLISLKAHMNGEGDAEKALPFLLQQDCVGNYTKCMKLLKLLLDAGAKLGNVKDLDELRVSKRHSGLATITRFQLLGKVIFG